MHCRHPHAIHRRASTGTSSTLVSTTPGLQNTTLVVVPQITSTSGSVSTSVTPSSSSSVTSSQSSDRDVPTTASHSKPQFDKIPAISSNSSPQQSTPSPTPSSLLSTVSTPETSVSVSISTPPPLFSTVTTPSPTPFNPSHGDQGNAPAEETPTNMTPRDRVLIITLSTFVGILTCLWLLFLLHRFVRRDGGNGVAEIVDAVSFYDASASASRHGGNPESFAGLTGLNGDRNSSSPEFKGRSKEADGHWERSGAGFPTTPTVSRARSSPIADVFDSRWPGRHIPASRSQRDSDFAVDSWQIVIASAGLGLVSCQTDVGSLSPQESQPPSPFTPFIPSVATPPANVSQEDTTEGSGGCTESKNEIERRQHEYGTWDMPPPEESDRAESSKTGPPAYSPGGPCHENIPPPPLPESSEERVSVGAWHIDGRLS